MSPSGSRAMLTVRASSSHMWATVANRATTATTRAAPTASTITRPGGRAGAIAGSAAVAGSDGAGRRRSSTVNEVGTRRAGSAAAVRDGQRLLSHPVGDRIDWRTVVGCTVVGCTVVGRPVSGAPSSANSSSAGADPSTACSSIGGSSTTRPRRAHATARARPDSVSSHPTTSGVVQPYFRVTWVEVGITTMRFGVTRHGPLAPHAFQLGKYEAFTTTGEPTLSTSKVIRLSDVLMLLTLAGSTGMRSGWSTVTSLPNTFESVATWWTPTRCHSFGPDWARATSWLASSMYHWAETSSQPRSPLPPPVRTAGWNASGETISESLTW